MKKYALLVGVEEYEGGSGVSTLKYACRDALVIADRLQNDCGFETVRRLVDREGNGMPTDTQILRELRDAAVRLNADDLFLFFFAGHGIEQPVDGTSRSYLLPRNADLEFRRGLLEIAELHKVLNKIHCRQRLILLDCCRNDPEAGKGDKDNLYGATLARDLSLASTRHKSEDRVTVLMTSCQPGKRAWEYDPVKHGIFSYYLQEGLGGAAWEDGTLEVGRLCRYVHDSLRKWSMTMDKEQIPDFKQLESPHPIILARREGGAGQDVPSRVRAPTAALVVCPLCGRRNEEQNTFMCHGCGRDYLCLPHQDPDEFICVRCLKERQGKSRVEAPEREEAKPVEPRPGEVWAEPYTDMEMVYVPGGRFLMGSPETEKERDENEGPQHEVVVAGFWLGKYPVTQGEWHKVMGKNPSGFNDDPRRPVEQVSWEDCLAYIEMLNRQSGRQYRLPSEAEWEYACRASTTTPFSFGETISTDQANYYGNYTYGKGREGVYLKKTTPVGSFPANGFGLHDLHGNIWEWCQDCFHDDYTGAPTDGSAWETDDGADRVFRGGSWSNDPRFLRSAYRSRFMPGNRYDYLGFRLVLTGQQPK